jgi:hypothetical protein
VTTHFEASILHTAKHILDDAPISPPLLNEPHEFMPISG